MRTIAPGSSNRNSASALVSSVLPTPVGPRNRKEPSGRLGSCKPGAGAADGGGDGLDRIGLADDARADRLLHAEQFGALALEHAFDRDPGPARDDRGDVLVGDFLAQHRALGRGGGLGELLLELGDAAVLELAGAGEVAAALRLLELDPRGVELALELRPRRRSCPCRPASAAVSSADCCSRLASSPSSVPRRSFDAESLSFLSASRSILSCMMRRSRFSISSGLDLDLHPQPRRGLVHQVDRLVGQEAVGDVAVAQRRRRDQRGIGDAARRGGARTSP